MNKNIFFILPVLFIIFSSPSFSSQDVKATSSHPTTTTIISPSNSTVAVGKSITFHAKVADYVPPESTPYGTVTWSDGGKGGKFNSTSCTLAIYSTSASTCTISYTPSIAGSVTINGTYGGKDGVHAGSFGLTSLTVTLRTSTTTISGPVNATIGTLTTFYAKVNDPGTGTKTLPTGRVTWSDGGKGGIFSASSCILAPFKGSSSESICSVIYTRSTAGSITITGTYGGDSSHSGSFGTLGFKVY